MAIDLEAIRRKVQELSGIRRTSSVQLWKPGLGEHKVRGLPWKSVPDGMPFIERWFYYIGNNSGILAPYQFNEPDPINEMITKLYSTKKPEDRLMANKLRAKMRTYMPIVVRGQEDKGVLVWSFGKTVYNRLLSFFTEEDVGDILDPSEGFDLKVTISQQPGKQFMDTVVDPTRRSTKLSDEPKQIQAWLESVPNIDDMYRKKSVQEIEAVLNGWLAGGDAVADMSEGTAKGAPAKTDELDSLVSEVRGDTKSEDVPAAKASRKVKGTKPEDGTPPAEKKSLDAAFDELMNDD